MLLDVKFNVEHKMDICRELEREKKENWKKNVDGTMIVFYDKEKAGGSKTKKIKKTKKYVDDESGNDDNK
ncbi:hypothetical protein L1987_33984 [Smallanthus sonchifolius]|uniref:Uncharacterized protein n=1 Tax=Smallanthus sonchifolius TaxID=185202 RepID=A0ACB9HTT2_9ASTR|nr:hypothetical protein L1987_33984 [Smallanthus sonchifolius]